MTYDSYFYGDGAKKQTKTNMNRQKREKYTVKCVCLCVNNKQNEQTDMSELYKNNRCLGSLSFCVGGDNLPHFFFVQMHLYSINGILEIIYAGRVNLNESVFGWI